MRSALLCVFFALIIERGSRALDDDFRPIPIPLEEYYEKRESRVGTLHETIRTEQPPAVAALPAHYWEDALRHSVYLTLVRDKIDQLIAKGVVVSADNKPEQYASKEVDDRDLWEKIKQAPFDRIQDVDHSLFGDVTIMAKGRLIEDNGGFRFTEDERSREECSEDKCFEGVKAFWSVKRVRQRDVETSPGRYHYELTFSVNSQPPKKQKRPYENPIRTFTVRENSPDTLVGKPQEHHGYQPARPQGPRPQRAVWFHKNIAPKQYNNQGRYYNQGLDRIFSSFFSDDDSHAEPPPRYKPNPYPPQMYPQFSKVGYVGMPSDQHQQKRLMPYPYKPNMYKYRPPLPAPPVGLVQQHYLDVDVINHHQYPMQPPDHRYISPSNIVKTTRPAVAPPTPPMTYATTTPKNVTAENSNTTTVTEETTKMPEMPTVYKSYTKQRPVKVSYFSDHVRPPIYNAPPGVFVTMEKKPFKPMPPLKYTHSPKPHKRPIDFRPSPQLIDGQLFSNPETSVESAFRPILVNNSTDTDIEDIEVTHSIRHGNKQNVRKQTSKKPPKKHENIKSQRITTTAPDIITVNNEEEDDMQWADLLSAFTKTTPMETHKAKKPEDPQVDSSEVSTAAMNALSKIKAETTEAYEEKTTTTTSTTTTTTPAPKKRTRPPHKFVKPEKVKKHKRITTTTKAPEKSTLRKPSDLTPQASSAATGAPKTWKPKNKTTTPPTTTEQPSTTSTITTSTSTTTPTPTTRSSYVEMTTKTETVKPSQPKNKNRFRISTLMQKGTSVKHDRWSVNVNTNTTDKKITVPPTGKYPPRRKGSNFQGYGMPSTSKYLGHTHEDDFHKDHYSSRFETSTTTEPSTVASTAAPATTQPTYEDTNDYYHHKESLAYTQHHDDFEEDDDDDDNEDIEVVKENKDDQQEAEDHSEFIFGVSSTTPSEKTNEIIEEEQVITEQPIITTAAAPKNKTKKCRKKKKNHHLVSTTTLYPEEEVLETTTPTPTSTKSSTGIDFLDEILGSLNNYEETTEKTKETKQSKPELDEEESENHEKYLKIDEDFEDFLGNLGGKERHPDEIDNLEYEDEHEHSHEPLTDDDVSPFDNEDVNESARDTNDKDYDDYRERSYSLLELMAME